jgi:hypothetical protein
LIQWLLVVESWVLTFLSILSLFPPRSRVKFHLTDPASHAVASLDSTSASSEIMNILSIVTVTCIRGDCDASKVSRAFDTISRSIGVLYSWRGTKHDTLQRMTYPVIQLRFIDEFRPEMIPGNHQS